MSSEAPSSEAPFLRRCGIATLLGLALVIASTALLPMRAHPNEAASAFAEYARDDFWVLKHLALLVGQLLVGAGFVSLTWYLAMGRSRGWALLAGAALLVCGALTAVLQAVDGVAFKFMVDHLAAAPAAGQIPAFEATFAVRQVTIGLNSGMGVLFGLASVVYGIAILRSGLGVWLAVLGVMGGLCVLATAIVQAHTGYSDIALATGMFSSLIAALWIVGVGVFLMRSADATGAA